MLLARLHVQAQAKVSVIQHQALPEYSRTQAPVYLESNEI